MARARLPAILSLLGRAIEVSSRGCMSPLTGPVIYAVQTPSLGIIGRSWLP